MFCGKCGNQLPDNVQFCAFCGTAQQPAPQSAKPAKSKKKFPVWIVIAAAAVLVVGIAAAIVLPILFPGTVTVYQLESYTYYGSDGEQKMGFEYEFDENGNPTTWGDYVLARTYEAEYDDHGNLTEKYNSMLNNDMGFAGVPSKYKYSYYDDGRIKSCKEYYNDKKVADWNFTWDKKGNLIQVMMDDEPMLAGYRIVRQDWEYDKKGRLVTEYVCAVAAYPGPDNPIECGVYRYEYFYNDAGNLESWECTVADELVKDFEDLDYMDLDFDERKPEYCELTYNEDGTLLTVETNSRGGDISECEIEYDRDGNPIFWDTYEYDDHGNLLYGEAESGYRYAFEYEAVEMTKEAARRYDRWVSLLNLDPVKRHCYPVISSAGQSEMFYYYLIPNPVW